MNSKYKKLWENLKDPEFRKQFIDAYVDEGIAFQIRALRNKKELTQPKFAEEIGVKQPLVSAWENPNYGKYSLNTLKKLAKAFDVGLLVRFVRFSTLVEWTIDLASDAIAPPSFGEEEEKYLALSVPTTAASTQQSQGVNTMNGFIDSLKSLDEFQSTAPPHPSPLVT